jgi:hypothetical protein
MTEREHTTAKLARALEAVPGVPEAMIKRACDGYYHDFLSPLATPEIQLVADLRELASAPATPRNSRPLLRALATAVIDGQYDASKEESDEWARSPEGQEAMAELAGLTGRVVGERVVAPGPPAGVGDEDAVKACADLVSRTGAKSFECGYVHEGAPIAEAGWYATAVYKGAKITAEDKISPAEACDALADRLLSGAQCQHCKGLVTLSDRGAFAFRKATLATGQRWDAEDAAKAPQCRWTRTGARWERGCA